MEERGRGFLSAYLFVLFLINLGRNTAGGRTETEGLGVSRFGVHVVKDLKDR